MGLWRSLNGEISVKLTSADTEGMLSAIDDAGITVYEVCLLEPLTMKIRIRRQELKRIRAITHKRGGKLQLDKRIGAYWDIKSLLHRPVLLLGLAAIFLLGLYLPTRIFFIQVEGNVTVPTNLIIEQAELCGIRFGAMRSEVRSEKMKNALLQALPQLQWAGINTSGCLAVISVRERDETEVQNEKGVSSIVAVRDGVISSCTVTRGNGVCRPGQAVRAGEVLISGYTDCGLSVRADQAEGEVFAKTERELSVITPVSYHRKMSVQRKIKKYGLIIGKKRINFYEDSGILDPTCDKMYLENYVTLPGGFVLPVALITEEWTYYDTSAAVSVDDASQQLQDFAREYLSEQMIAGAILSADETVMSDGATGMLTGRYACEEMIGRVQKEEIIKPNDKHD